MRNKWILFAACLAGASGVALGALGAHGLEDRLATANMTAVWQTAVAYQMWHALALLALLAVPVKPVTVQLAGGLWVSGILLFSGSLYILALDGPRWLGPVTPLGGLALIIGWLILGCAVFTASAPARKNNLTDPHS